MVPEREALPLDQAETPLFVGVDVGGTNVKIGILDNQGRTLAYRSIPTQEQQGPAGAVARIACAVKEMAAERGIDLGVLAGLGLGTPGTMDIPSGMILEPPNLPHWRHFPIRDRLAELSGLPVEFVNDANAAAFGEYWIGSGRAFDSMIMLTLGTGVGGGIIVNDMLIEGVNSFGSECGHMIVDSREDARLCVWGGGRGELEAYASASAVARLAAEQLEAGRVSSLADRLAGDIQPTALMVAQEAEAGDALCLEVVLETARYLGYGVVNLVHMIDPGVVILGGAMDFGGRDSKVGRRFLDRVIEVFESRAFDVVVGRTIIDFANLGGDAGYIGAAGIARARR